MASAADIFDAEFADQSLHDRRLSSLSRISFQVRINGFPSFERMYSVTTGEDGDMDGDYP